MGEKKNLKGKHIRTIEIRKKHSDSMRKHYGNKQCLISDCKNKYYGKGYCKSHYRKIILKSYTKALNNGTYLKRGICKFDGCEKGVYAKGFCRNHYKKFRLKGTAASSLTPCNAKGCKKTSILKYCRFHMVRFRAGIPLNIEKFSSNKGAGNHMWRGGISDYPNHNLMKKNKKLKIKQTNGKCEDCGGIGVYIHHKDKKRNNHKLSNLKLLCLKCHWKYHTGGKKISKFVRLYGINIMDMKEKYGLAYSYINKYHKLGELKNILIAIAFL